MPFTVDIVPGSARVPGTYLGYDTRSALSGLGMSDITCALVGQKLAAGTADLLKVYQLTSEADAANLFGAGSWLHRMVRDALVQNPYGKYVAVCGADDGTKATLTLTIAGTPVSAGYLYLGCAGESMAIPFTTTDTPTTIAARSATELAKPVYAAWPVTVAAVAGVVTFTAKNGGGEGNTITVSTSFSAVGTGITALVGAVTRGAMAGGADGAFDLKTLLDVLTPGRYGIVCVPYTSQTRLTLVKTYLDFVSGPVEQRPGVAIAAVTTDTTTSTTLAKALNSRRMVIGSLKDTDTPSPQVAAALSAVMLAQPDPALPFDGYELPTVIAPPAGKNFSRQDQESILLCGGITPLEVTRAGGVSIVRLISTEIDGPSAQLPDVWVRSMDFVREACITAYTPAFKGGKLTTKTPGAVRSVLLGVMVKLEQAEIVKNVQLWKDRLIVIPDENNLGWIKVRIPADVVVGLHGMTGFIELLF